MPAPAAAEDSLSQYLDPATVELREPVAGLAMDTDVDDETVAVARVAAIVRAVGHGGDDGDVSPDQVRAAAADLGVEHDGGRVTARLANRIRAAYVARSTPALREIGIVGPDAIARPRHVREAATALGIDTKGGVGPALLDAVVDGAREELTPRRREHARPYMRALGIEPGTGIEDRDVDALAAALGIELPHDLGGRSRQRVHSAWLQTFEPLLQRLGISHGQRVVDADVRALAGAVDVPLVRVGPDEARAVVAEARARPATPVVFARRDGLEIRLPSTDVAGAGFHQATRGAALALEPAGHDAAFDLPSRGRGTHGRSAVDIAVAPGTQVLSPVAGTVVEVSNYDLYGQHPDTRIQIRPDDDPSTVVVLLHVTGPEVAVGDRVGAGEPIAAHATQFPFPSQIDRVVGTLPHVHMEVWSA